MDDKALAPPVTLLGTLRTLVSYYNQEFSMTKSTTMS